MSILDRVENQEAIEAAKAEILAALEKTNGKLDIGVTANVVKSIQRVTYDVPIDKSDGFCRISTVNPERCIVLMERLWDDTADGCAWVDYRLSAKELSLSHGRYVSSPGIHMGYWIVEFY